MKYFAVVNVSRGLKNYAVLGTLLNLEATV